MPPSSGDAFHDQVSIFQHTTTVQILGAHHVASQIISIKSYNATKNTIAAQFYGHSHVVSPLLMVNKNLFTDGDL